jgi:SAM-dependent methyltransferase
MRLGLDSAVVYHDWHGRPGYYGDITRHFDRTMRILDVGCGTAWLGHEFPDYVGVDTDPSSLEVARVQGLDVRPASADGRLDFIDCSFDGVILKDVLEHVADPVTLVREVRRVLRPGGIVWASSPDAQRSVWHDYTHVRPYTRTAMRRLFADHGFLVHRVSYESVAPGSGRTAARTRTNRRIAIYRIAAHLRFLPRNVWILAERAR